MVRLKDTLPRARSHEELVVEELPQELLVYDRTTNKAHRLNDAAALVWRHCDGSTTVEAMVGVLEARGLPAKPEVVELALDQLQRAQLIESIGEKPTGAYLRSRREVLRRIGLIAGAAVLLPIVQSIVAPSVAQAASCGGLLQACCGGTNCSAPFVCTAGICDFP